MLEYIKYLNKLSLYTSIAMVAITSIGYVLGITILCGSLFALVRLYVLTVTKIVIYFMDSVYKRTMNNNFINIMFEEGLAIC